MQSTTLDNLPKQFVSAMRTLFYIMDDKHTGYVNFSDIEHRWQDDGTKGLPKGVIESLQKVTPPNGKLSFERFCAGLKICLLRNQVEHKQQQQQNNNNNINNNNSNIVQPNRPPSAPLLDLDCAPKSGNNWTNAATVKPTHVITQQQRTLSMPQLLLAKTQPTDIDSQQQLQQQQHLKSTTTVTNLTKPLLYGPPKPPRTNPSVLDAQQQQRPTIPDRNLDRAEIRTALQNWQIGLMLNEEKATKTNNPNALIVRASRSSGDGKPSGQLDNIYQQQSQQQSQSQTQQQPQAKKVNARRREPRRHTLQNGIDYNMLKRMKQIEQEKDVLMQGLQAVEKARDWYLKQVATIQEKMKYLGRMGSHMEQWTEAQQERLELQRARVLEVNRHLLLLTDSWERGGLPLHMNLAVYSPLPNSITAASTHRDGIVSRIKQQNHLLTEEVSKKSDRIAMLELEKASLIRELLQMRAGPRSGQEEAIF